MIIQRSRRCSKRLIWKPLSSSPLQSPVSFPLIRSMYLPPETPLKLNFSAKLFKLFPLPVDTELIRHGIPQFHYTFGRLSQKDRLVTLLHTPCFSWNEVITAEHKCGIFQARCRSILCIPSHWNDLK